MDFLTLAQQRWSVRKYSPTPVEPDKLERILQAGLIAPTAVNAQPHRLLVITGEDALAALRECTNSHFFAPAAILVCHDRTARWVRPFDGKDSGDIDAAIVTTHMMLQATELGLGSVWVMHFDPAAIREKFNLPDHYEPTALLVLGYAAEDAQPAGRHFKRLPREQTVFFDRF